MNIQTEANIEPAMVTARQPYLFTKEDEIGPIVFSFEIKQNRFVIDILLWWEIFLCVYEIFINLPEQSVIPLITERIQDV